MVRRSYRKALVASCPPATAMAAGDDLEAVVTCDDRMLDAARLLGIPHGDAALIARSKR